MANNNANLVYGGDVMVFLSTGSTLQPAAFSTNATLTINLSEREISSKDSGDWTEVQGGKFDWSMTTDALMNLAGVTGTTMSTKEVYQYFLGKVAVNVAFASKTGTSPSWTADATKINFTGKALITSMTLNASNSETGTYSISFKGTGALAIA